LPLPSTAFPIRLRSGKYDEEVRLYAFDILALDGEDLRVLPLSLRKTNLARLLARRPSAQGGVQLRAPGHRVKAGRSA
jgi:ATP-dependent DNA ligase